MKRAIVVLAGILVASSGTGMLTDPAQAKLPRCQEYAIAGADQVYSREDPRWEPYYGVLLESCDTGKPEEFPRGGCTIRDGVIYC